MITIRWAAALCLPLILAATDSTARTAEEQAFVDVYRQLVEINTTLSQGSCTEAAQAMTDRLLAAGMPEQNVRVLVPAEWPRQGNMVAVIPGSSPEAGSMLLLAHIDVVEANPEDWERDPFKLIEENGRFYARGSVDDKAMASIFVDLLMRMSKSGYQPRRSIKLALTCGEETPNTFNGVRYLLAEHRDLIDADFALNEGAFGMVDETGRRLYNGVLAGEKTYQDFHLEIHNPGGHSSRPVPDNAIYRLAAALGRIAAFSFPIEFNDTTRRYFEQMADIEGGATGADLKAILADPPDPQALARVRQNPSFNSVLHTTCVATTMDAGHAPNALPQRASANVNCRIYPGRTQEEIRRTLIEVVADPDIAVTFAAPPEETSPPPPLTAEILAPIEAISQQMWPGVPVLPFMQAGATDGRFLTPAGIPTYSASGLFADPGKLYLHGLNEQIPVASLLESRDFLDRLVRAYAGGS